MLSTKLEYPEDTLHHECGVVGIFLKNPITQGQDDIYRRLVELLISIENRGQHSAGISTFFREEGIDTYKDCGTVEEVFSSKVLKRINRSAARLMLVSAIGHVRWATAGEGNSEEAQPWQEKLDENGAEFSIAFNGHIANYEDLRKEMEGKINPLTKIPYKFATKVDTELLSYLIMDAYNQGHDIPSILQYLESKIVGSFNILFIATKGEVFAYRDRHGFHPLCFSDSDSCFEFSSESVALEDGSVRHLKPGEAFIIDKGKKAFYQQQILPPEPQICSLEFMYFANNGSEIDGVKIRTMREFLGEELSKLEKWSADTKVKVVPVPASAIVAGESFAANSNLQVQRALTKKAKGKRSYTAPSHEIEQIIAGKFIYEPEDLPEEIVLVDDTLIKGSTLKKVISEFRRRGVKRIHVRIAAPPITSTCPFGVYIEVQKLIMNKFSFPTFDYRDEALNRQIAEAVGADSIKFLAPKNVDTAHKLSGGNGNLCMGCMTQDYPGEVQKYL